MYAKPTPLIRGSFFAMSAVIRLTKFLSAHIGSNVEDAPTQVHPFEPARTCVICAVLLSGAFMIVAPSTMDFGAALMAVSSVDWGAAAGAAAAAGAVVVSVISADFVLVWQALSANAVRNRTAGVVEYCMGPSAD